MKVQIVNWEIGPTHAIVHVKTADDTVRRVIVPTQETLTEEVLKKAIQDSLTQGAIMYSRMKILRNLMWQEIEVGETEQQ